MKPWIFCLIIFFSLSGHWANAELKYFGGLLIPHAKVFSVFLGDTKLDFIKKAQDFYPTILESPQYMSLLTEYSIKDMILGQGSYLGDATDPKPKANLVKDPQTGQMVLDDQGPSPELRWNWLSDSLVYHATTSPTVS